MRGIDLERPMEPILNSYTWQIMMLVAASQTLAIYLILQVCQNSVHHGLVLLDAPVLHQAVGCQMDGDRDCLQRLGYHVQCL